MILKKNIINVVIGMFSIILSCTIYAQIYSDKSFWKTLSEYKEDSTNYFTRVSLFVEDWKIGNKGRELEVKGSVWITQGQIPNLDTTAYVIYHIFLATPINNVFQNKRTIFDNCKRTTESNEFLIKCKIKKGEGLYIDNCGGGFFRDWRMDTLFFERDMKKVHK
jgi:hypothetical protein